MFYTFFSLGNLTDFFRFDEIRHNFEIVFLLYFVDWSRVFGITEEQLLNVIDCFHIRVESLDQFRMSSLFINVKEKSILGLTLSSSPFVLSFSIYFLLFSFHFYSFSLPLSLFLYRSFPFLSFSTIASILWKVCHYLDYGWNALCWWKWKRFLSG